MPDAMAGPWVDDQAGHGFVQLAYNRYSASDYFTGPGETLGEKHLTPGTKQHILVPLTPTGSFFPETFNTNYLDQSALFYGEVSLSHGFGFAATLPLVHYITEDIFLTPESKLSQVNVGDLNVGAKYQIPHIKALRGFDFGPQIFFTAPTGDVNGRAAYPPVALTAFKGTPPLPMPTGNGVADMEMRGSFGYSFYPIPMFITADVGYRHRLDAAVCTEPANPPTTTTATKSSVNYSDDLPFAVQVGGTWSPKWKGFDHLTLIASVNGTHSFENGDVPGRNGAAFKGPLFAQPCGQANNQSVLNLGGSILIFPIKYFGVTYTIAHTLTGVNTGYGLINTVGFASQF